MLKPLSIILLLLASSFSHANPDKTWDNCLSSAENDEQIGVCDKAMTKAALKDYEDALLTMSDKVRDNNSDGEGPVQDLMDTSNLAFDYIAAYCKLIEWDNHKIRKCQIGTIKHFTANIRESLTDEIKEAEATKVVAINGIDDKTPPKGMLTCTSDNMKQLFIDDYRNNAAQAIYGRAEPISFAYHDYDEEFNLYACLVQVATSKRGYSEMMMVQKLVNGQLKIMIPIIRGKIKKIKR